MRIIKHFLSNRHNKENVAAIESINLFGNDLTSLHDSYHDIIKNSYLKKLNMSKQNLSEKFLGKILDALKNTTIKSINLSHNGFGIDSAKAVAACLRINSTFEELDISNNRIGTDGAKMISHALFTNISTLHTMTYTMKEH